MLATIAEEVVYVTVAVTSRVLRAVFGRADRTP